MEYLEGQTLNAYIRENGCMEPSACIRIMLLVMDSLVKFQQTSMIHGYINPDNFMFIKIGNL